MLYLLAALMLAMGYHTLTYGVYVWKKEKNKMGAAAVIGIAVLGTIIPLGILFVRN